MLLESPDFSEAISMAYVRLHLAIVLQAIYDLQNHPADKNLKSWLLVDGLFILEAYDQPIDINAWKDFVESGCPGKFKMVRNDK